MKNILVPVEEHHGISSMFQTALLAAGRFRSRVEAIPLGVDLGTLIAVNYAIPMVIADQAHQDLPIELEALFQRFCEQSDLPAGVSFEWNGAEVMTDEKVGGYGRIFDLIVVGRPGADPGDPRSSTLEAALFESGRPILIAPPKPPSAIGKTVVIAWNASTETARTVSLAMPYLMQAEKITVVSVTGAMSPGPSGGELAAMLARHGLDVATETVSDSSKPAGRLILSKAEALGADLLIKGGYTQSRLRQMIFGGATSQILAEAEIPVFMAH